MGIERGSMGELESAFRGFWCWYIREGDSKASCKKRGSSKIKKTRGKVQPVRETRSRERGEGRSSEDRQKEDVGLRESKTIERLWETGQSM